ncbi:MAG TPA: glycine cleavage system aminomethyltransferase GcvT, partial [Planctomycetaceae bacterium]|nr:glycine cleavage system aminomethyltransferase GcvT [Planctomycetaceae bacterium]
MLKTPCHDWHVEHGGRMVEFAGWHMPVQYTTISDEHRAVRSAAGLFDIAHMGRIRFEGPDAGRFLDSLLTNDVTKLQPGQVRYALVTNERGGILDDVLVYRFDAFYFLVVNAANREKILGWIERHRRGFDVSLQDLTLQSLMAALQGPAALSILAPLADADIGRLRYYHACETTVGSVPALVSRTGYTGEDGFEVIVSAEKALEVWTALLDQGRSAGLVPCGLGCRDTLRLEAAMPLYGHELDESIDPITAGLSFAVKLQAGDFIGRAALVAIHQSGPKRRRVGLKLMSRRIARQGCQLFVARVSEPVGTVTSGTFSPTLQQSIAMAYVRPEYSEPGIRLEVDVRGR